MSRRVVITGMGAITPIGNNVDEFWEGLRNGKVGIAPITRFDASNFKVNVAAEVKGFNGKDYLDPKACKRLDLFSQYAMVAAREAMKQSGYVVTEENADRIGCIVGSGVGGMQTQENEIIRMHEKGPRRVSPFMVPMFISNMAAGNVAIDLGLCGKCFSIATACATGTHCIGEAFRSIKYGESDAMIAGGAEAGIVLSGVAGFDSLNAITTTEDPAMASIPFDLNRSGFVVGEGAGIVMLEELESAKARKANILAEIVGYGATCDAFHITCPLEDGSGSAKAMKLALNEAGIAPEEVDYVNAHGTSTHINDATETRAIRTVFGEHADKLAVNSTKSMTGHLLGAAGAIECIASVKEIENGFVHPTVGLNNPDPECDLDYVPNVGRELDIRYAISNSLGFGGHNSAIVLKKYEE
ncbi:MAG: beta-ketoacyl-ACP synthase II [Clostridium sp.]|nr:beta-ketoacyl-ACP synthase II [Clostridium sp.]